MRSGEGPAPLWKVVNSHLLRGGKAVEGLKCITGSPRNLLNIMDAESGITITAFRLEGANEQSKSVPVNTFPSASLVEMQRMADEALKVALAVGVFTSG